MPAPAPIKCPAPDCATQYHQTPDNLPTYELVSQHLQMHIATNHAAAAPQAHLPGQATPQTSKVDKRSRPEVTQDMSEHDFQFFESEGNLYKRATGIQGPRRAVHLWAASLLP